MAMIKALSFSHAWVLWLTPLVLLLVGLMLLEMKRRDAFLQAFGEHALVRGFSRLGPEWPGRLRPLFLSLAFLGAVAALAEPVWGIRSEDHTQRPLDIVVLLDVSRSMGAEDYGPRISRLGKAQAMILQALPELTGRRVGVVTFAGAAFRQAPLTTDHTALEYVLTNWIFIESAPAGGSDIAQGIRTATRLFEGQRGERLLLLFSDGGQAQSEALRAALAEARAKAIRIFAFGLGGPAASKIPQYDSAGRFSGWLTVNGNIAMTRLDEGTMKEIAAATGGGYSRVITGRELGRTLDGLQITHAPSPGEARELFQWPLATALLLLWLERASIRLSGRSAPGALSSSPARQALTS